MARAMPRPDGFAVERQDQRIGPKFSRLADVLARGGGALELRADPTALAPERLLVFEVRGAIAPFAEAIRRAGLELVDEEELAGDEDDKAPVAYLMVPDLVALQNIASMWRRWRAGQLVRGETVWADVFERLRDLRTWGPADRVQPHDADILAAEIEGLVDNDLIRLEIELVFRAGEPAARDAEAIVAAAVAARGGLVVSRARIPEIAYHALLADLPVWAIQEVLAHGPGGIAGLEPVIYLRPQSVATGIEVDEPLVPDPVAHEARPLGTPILALLDGVPVAGHRLLVDHITLDDTFDLEPGALVAQRRHGTAMASLIIHGDRNRREPSLPRRVHVIPVMGNGDAFPHDRLVVDLIYLAVLQLRETAPDVVIVNLSLGNAHRPFHGQLSPWARLIDRLAQRFGLLFIVSGGNQTNDIGVPAYQNSIAFEDAAEPDRVTAMVTAINNIAADRRLLSPAETVNGITVGACNDDAVSPADRALARVLVDPFPGRRMANPSSALGPGFANAVKPDILMPGSREHLRVVRTHAHIDVRSSGPARGAGLRVAAPPAGGREDLDGYTSGTSAAAALASRTCHRIHDALEAAYGDEFLRLPSINRAVLLKALLIHPARWPEDMAEVIRRTIGPIGRGQASRQKDNIRRFLGFGCVDADEALACTADRATFFATGMLARDRTATIEVPVPAAIGGQARPHLLAATLAWFTPVSPGRKSYRSCKLRILDPDETEALAIKAHSNQPDGNQTNRGTVFTRVWAGDQAPAVTPNMTVALKVQREPDQAAIIDEPIAYGLAVTLAMPGELRLYNEVVARIAPPVRAGGA
ncbi:S8 family peptidase [Croceibacterium mercuriale]|uniref:S8 family peptidase n=1 Tax=Croceibacterium mercuriale TaxID=1572751 RepID=UPI001F34C185|nr:S8 family peptidase [Croceibacterium mercuriale]